MTSLFRPPNPVLIASGGGGGGGSSGSAIINATSSVIVADDPSTDSGAVQINADSVVALSVDLNQRIVIGDPADITRIDRLTLVDPAGSCLRLINSTRKSWARFVMDATDNLTISTSSNRINLGNNMVSLTRGSLYIGAERVTASAAQINYIDIVTAGTAEGLGALVTDASNSIAGINTLSATLLKGTIFTPYQPNINQMDTVNISTLKLNGTAITATANNLNLLHSVVQGTVVASKAVVVDSLKNINGFNILSADTLIGTLQTSVQSNITTVGTLNGLNVIGRVGIGTTTPSTTLEIKDTNPVIRFNNGVTIAEITMDANGNYLLNPQRSISIAPNRNMLFGGTSAIIGLAELTATSITGTLMTGNQPNITTIGTLTNLNTTEDVAIGTLATPSSSYRLTVTEPAGNLLNLSRSTTAYLQIKIASNGDVDLSPANGLRIVGNKPLIVDGPIRGVTDFSATTLSGTILTASQPNITTIGTLSSLNVTGAINAASLTAPSISGTILTAAQPNITSVGNLNVLTVNSNITAIDTITGDKLVGTLLTASQTNITQVGTLLSLKVTNGITANTITANAFSGTLSTAAQPNITSLGILSSVAVSGLSRLGEVTATSIGGTLTTAAQPNVTSLGTLTSLNVAGSIIATGNITGDKLYGTLMTVAQPNVTSIGTLTSLTVTGAITTAGNITGDKLYGTLMTAAQPNVTSLGTLTRVVTTGPIGIGMTNPAAALDILLTNFATSTAINIRSGTMTATLSMNSEGLAVGTNGTSIQIANSANLKMMGGTIIGLSTLNVQQITGTLMTAAQPNVTSLGPLTSLQTYYLGVGVAPDSSRSPYRVLCLDTTGRMIKMTDSTNELLINVTDGNYMLNTNCSGIALGPSVDLILNGGTIIGLDILHATTVNANNLGGTITTSYQPNITRLGDLLSLNVIGGISANSATLASAHITGGLTVDGPLTLTTPLSFDNLNSSTGYFNANLPPVSSTNGGTLTVIGGAAFSGDVIIGNSIQVGNAIITETTLDPLLNTTPGVVSVGIFLESDSGKNLVGFNTLGATSFVGTLTTASQPNITSLGNLTGLNVCGYLGVGTKSPLKQVEINSTTGDCLRLSYNKPTVASSYMDISVGATGNATLAASGGTINIGSVVSTNQIILGNTTNNIMPLELGYVPYTMTTSYSYKYASNANGVINPATSGYVSYNYSIRACGRILCTQSIDVASDRRVKKNITPLTDEWCTSFIEDTTPVAFKWINGEDNTSFGYIAQDLLKHGYHELVNLVADDELEADEDDDGFASPEGIKLTISYEHIIPILAKNQKRLIKENAELKAKLDRILEMLQEQ